VEIKVKCILKMYKFGIFLFQLIRILNQLGVKLKKKILILYAYIKYKINIQTYVIIRYEILIF